MKNLTIDPRQQEQMLNTITMAGAVNQNIVGTLKLIAEGDPRETPRKAMLNTINIAGAVNQNIVGTLKLIAEGDTKDTPRIVKVLQEMLAAVSGIVSLLNALGLTKTSTNRPGTEAES